MSGAPGSMDLPVLPKSLSFVKKLVICFALPTGQYRFSHSLGTIVSYGTVVIIIKVFSYALTAGSGVLGLVSEFKDENKRITRAGKLALAGIAVGFSLQTMMTVLEARNSRGSELQHEKEIKRLARPLGEMQAEFDFSLDASLNSEYLTPLRNYFKKT